MRTAPADESSLDTESILMFADTKAGQRVNLHILSPHGYAVTVNRKIVYRSGGEGTDAAAAIAVTEFRRAAGTEARLAQ